MKTLYLECQMGASGDMLMGALYELCEKKDLFIHTMNEVFSQFHVSVSAEPATKCGINGTKMQIRIRHRKEQPAETAHEHNNTEHEHTSYADILSRINQLAFPEAVKNDIAAIYKLIGDAESKVHGVPLKHIHFHEVGTLDALADVAGCALLIYLLVPDHIICSPIHVGSGFVKCAHGVLPVPAPATAELLKGIPYYTGTVASELLTPTGAAILKYFVDDFSPMPPLTVSSIGYGMGEKDFDTANCVRAFLGNTLPELSSHRGNPKNEGKSPNTQKNSKEGNTAKAETSPDDADQILSISCNLDDITGEAIGLATEILFAAGALDVYTIPIQMKKNRPGILLTCLCKPEDKEKFTGLFFLHTTTRGVRYQYFTRAKMESTVEKKSSRYGTVRVKKSTGYGIEKEKPEFEDLKSIVLKNGCSMQSIEKELK